MYKPTLGGLKKLQQFLGKNGYSMPVVQTNIFKDGMVNGKYLIDKGEKISLKKAIRKQGAGHKVINVRLANDKGDRWIQLVDLGYSYTIELLPLRRFAILQFSKSGTKFERLVRESFGLNEIAVWGKEAPTLADKFLSRFCPGYYWAKISVGH